MAQQDDFIRTALRVPPDLHKSLHVSASANNRTFNAEIVVRLTNSFNDVQDANTQATMLAEIYLLLNAQRQELLTLHKQSMDELVRAANASPPF